MRFCWMALCMLVLGCADGRSSIEVSVESAGIVRGIDHFTVVVSDTQRGLAAAPINVALAGAPVDLPPAQAFFLNFDASVSGSMHLALDAVSAGGSTLVHGEADVVVSPSQTIHAVITLAGEALAGDMGNEDGGSRDLGMIKSTATQSRVIADPAAQVADGVAVSTITVVARDADDHTLSGQMVSLSATGSANAIGPSSSLTNGSGVATFTIKSTKAEDKVITATIDAGQANPIVIVQTVTVTFTAGIPSEVAAHSTVVVTKTNSIISYVLADNLATWTITVTLRDLSHNPVPGELVGLGTNPADGNTITPSIGTTDADGIATFLVKSTKAGVKTVSAMVAGNLAHGTIALAQTPAIVFILNASLATVVATPLALLADGIASTAATVTILDVFSNPVPDVTIALSATGSSNNISPASATTNASGVASFTLKSLTAEVKTVSATATVAGLDALAIPQTASATFYYAVPNSTFTVNPNGTSTMDDDTVTDSATGLVWQRVLSYQNPHQAAALSYCQALSISGASWVLPTLPQLQGIFDVNVSSPKINHEAFPGSAGVFWSSNLNEPDGAFGLNFDDGSTPVGEVSCGMMHGSCLGGALCYPRIRCVHN